jgi:hypothetical protein
MIVRIYGIDARSRPAAIALAAVALAAGAVLLAIGIVLLLGVAAVGTVIGGGVMLLRAITGRGRPRLDASRAGLDPALEVYPVDPAAAKPLPPSGAHKPTSSEAD